MQSSTERKFTSDVMWNVASLGVSGVCGIALNYLISEVYDPAALGVFNQVFAAYIFFTQLAALGIHLSALQRIAATGEQGERAAIATSALIVTGINAALIALIFWITAPLVGALVESTDVARGMKYATLGVLFFALDKAALGCLNGVRRMRWYAVLSAGRFLFMLAGFAVCVVIDADAAVLPVILSAAEVGTFVLAIFAIRDLLRRLPLSELMRRAKMHLAFGGKGFMSGVLAELNTRVDILMLGFFVGDAMVGVYSFAAILAEGFLQLLVVLRSNYAPIVARMLAHGDREELLALIRRGRNRTYLAAFPVAVLAVVGYALVVPLVSSSAAIADSWPFFGVLVAGMALSAGYIPFSQVLLHAHRPGWHTWFMLSVVAVNIVANAVLIPWLGPIGAAAATAFALFSSVFILRVMSRRLLRLPI